MRAVRAGGVVGLVGLLWLWHTVGLHDAFVFRGGTALNGVLTALVILACRQPVPGPLARGLGIRPLRDLGKISYGVYLFHWPLFLLLDEDRLHVHGYVLFAIRVGATLALAVLSYHLLESPYRFGIRGRPGRLVAALTVSAATLVLLVVVVPVHRSQLLELPAQAATRDDGGRGGPTAFKADVAGDGGPHPVADVLLVGDSVSWTMWPGLLRWNETHPDRTIHADGVMALGCTLGRAGTPGSSASARRRGPTASTSAGRSPRPSPPAATTFDGSHAVGAWVVPQILDAVSNDRVSRGDRTDRPDMGEPGGDQ